MKARTHSPLHLDVAALAEDGADLRGQWPLATLQRLAASSHPEVGTTADTAAGTAVDWSARGERRSGTAGVEPEVWLHLQASTALPLQCQRCLEPVDVPLAVERSLRFVRGEEQAAALDADSEDDVLALERSIDLRRLVEDELLLALPLVPSHEHCPRPLPVAPEEAEAVEERPASPFAVLQSLKKSGSPGQGH